jgi:hypothetical protein
MGSPGVRRAEAVEGGRSSSSDMEASESGAVWCLGAGAWEGGRMVTGIVRYAAWSRGDGGLDVISRRGCCAIESRLGGSAKDGEFGVRLVGG